MMASDVNDPNAKDDRDSPRSAETTERGRRAFVRLRKSPPTPSREGTSSASPVFLPEISSDRLMVVGVLAEDSCGRVLHAYDQGRREHVAVKQLSGPASPIADARFRRGALLPARLRHRGIVEIHGIGRWPQGDRFFVMELIRGFEFTALLQQAHTLRERLPLLRHITACAEAIGCAHRSRIIHRDIKPENVLISSRGHAVVIDWGIAKDLDRVESTGDSDLFLADGTDPRRTVAGQVMGTPAYMAPEQAWGGDVDERADVYALGGLLLHTLTGIAPYPGDDAKTVLKQVISGPPPALSMLSASLRPALVAVVERALARDPDDRYANANELAHALHELAL